MRAVQIEEFGGPEVLHVSDVPKPEPAEGEVLIKVSRAGMNFADTHQRENSYLARYETPMILGGEVAGTTPDGRRVVALVPSGGYAEYAVAPETATLPIPQGLSMVEAAALPETVFTVWHNIFERAALKPGEWLLVHGGASGIGTTAIPIAAALGAKVMATVGSAEKAHVCRELGATRAINYHEDDFVEAVHETTGGNGADVILDMVGGDYVERDLKAAALEGRIVQIAFLKGSKVELDLMRLMLRRLTLTGSTLRVQSAKAKARMAKAIEERIWPLVTAGEVKPVIDSTFPLKDAAEAHRRIDAPDHIGKIVLIAK